MTGTPTDLKKQPMPAHQLNQATLVEPNPPEELKPECANHRSRPQANSLRVEVVRDIQRLRELVPAWESLANAAVERNVFYEPFMVFPALEHLGPDQAFEFVLIFGTGHVQPGEQPVLYGLFPLERRAGFHGIPISVLELWGHIHCFLYTPLIHRDCVAEVTGIFLDWLQEESGSKLLALRRISADGPFYQALIEHLSRRGLASWVSRNYVRAVMRRTDNGDVYLERAVSSRRRKEYRRQERRFAELGALQYKVLTAGGDLEAWSREFLQVEGSGWKGRNSSALCSNNIYKSFYQGVTQGAFAKGRLQMLAMYLDGKVIAQKVNFTSGAVAFSFKIGFDEKYRQYSPGVLLELENIRRFHNDECLDWMDSCADPDHPMIDRLWTERRTIQSLIVELGKPPAGFVLALAPLLRWVKRRIV